MLLACVPAVAHADAPRFGVMADVGVPSGATGSLVYRPFGALRVHAGGGHNLVGPGLLAGITLAPLRRVVSPTLALDAGRYFERDANAAVTRVAGAPSDASPEGFGYDFASAHAGLEIGGDWFTFYVHGGVSYVRGDWTDTTTLDDGDVTTMTDVHVRAVGVSARLGFVAYFAK